MSKFYYDSYAIIEFLKGNVKFQSYFIKFEGITSFYNILEVYYSILKEEGEFKANQVLELISPLVMPPKFDDVEPSMKFRLKHKKKKFSYTDCLGYTMAKRENLKFLTGDEGFKQLPNVEFVKA